MHVLTDTSEPEDLTKSYKFTIHKCVHMQTCMHARTHAHTHANTHRTQLESDQESHPKHESGQWPPPTHGLEPLPQTPTPTTLSPILFS